MTPPSSPATAGPKHRVWLYNCRVHGTSPVWRDDPVPTDGPCNAGDSTYPPWKEPCRIIRTLVGPGDAHLYSSRGTTHCDNDCLVCFPSAPEPSGRVTDEQAEHWGGHPEACLDWPDCHHATAADERTCDEAFIDRLLADRTQAQRCPDGLLESRIGDLEAALDKEHERASLDSGETVDIEHPDPCAICALIDPSKALSIRAGAEAGRALDKQRIASLEAALRERSEARHLAECISTSYHPWDECPRDPCASDRALLAPPTEDSPHA